MDTFSSLLRAFDQRAPDQNVLTLQRTGQPDFPLSRHELLLGAAGYNQALAQAGIQPGEVVVLILQPGPELVSAFFGAVLRGAIPSIMPFLTEKLIPERYRADLAALIEITRPAAIVTYAEFEGEVRSALKAGGPVREVLVTEHIKPAASLDWETYAGLQRSPEDIVLLQHSSGTTGLQKGVALSHHAVLTQLESYSQALHINDQDVIVSWLPLYHDMGLIAGFLLPILKGIPLVLLSPFDWVRAPYRLLQAVSHYRGTLTWLPNFAYNFCAQKIRARDLQEVDLRSWRAVINCSEPMRWESMSAFLEAFRPYGLAESAPATCYAMAENVFAVTQGGIDRPVVVDEIDRESMQVERVARPASPDRPSLKMPSAGQPIAGVEVRVLDADGKVAVERQIGEVALRSACMLTGYYHRPDETRKALRDGWYLTGDYGYLAGGELYVTGRKKDLIIVGGKNIYPQDLETLAMEVKSVHAGRVVAFGVFNEAAGTEEVTLLAEVDSDDPVERERIADEIRQVVTRGSAVALRRVHLVEKHWLIKTSSGKTARGANKEKFLKEAAQE
jgi:fatty-acyl-CoA synthase